MRTCFFMCCSHGYRNFKIEIHSALSVLLSIHLFISSLGHFDLWLFGVNILVSVVGLTWLVVMLTYVDWWLGLISYSFIIVFNFQSFPSFIEADLIVVNCFSVPSPRRLRFKVLSSSKLLVSWKEPKGDFDSYLFLYNSTGRISLLFKHTHTLWGNASMPKKWDFLKCLGGKDPIMTWIFCLSGRIM